MRKPADMAVRVFPRWPTSTAWLTSEGRKCDDLLTEILSLKNDPYFLFHEKETPVVEKLQCMCIRKTYHF